MTEQVKAKVLAKMMGTPDDEIEYEVLSAYLTLAGFKILNRMYPYQEDFEGMDVPTKYEALQLKIACYMLNKRGAEGQIQHIENGIHRNYGDADIPDSMMAEVTPFCQVIR